MEVIPPSLILRVRSAFRSFVEQSDYPCLGARATLRHAGYHLGVYGPMCSETATQELSLDLGSFLDAPESAHDFATFVSVFIDVAPEQEGVFESRLWQQLEMLHALDPSPTWDPSVSADPSDPYFSFSFGATACFVVGLHPQSSRVARSFEWPTLVFNPHAQFQRMRATGLYSRLSDAVRARDLAVQGSLNPNLADFGTLSEARQYSGRATEPGWQCPFRPESR